MISKSMAKHNKCFKHMMDGMIELNKVLFLIKYNVDSCEEN
jgi:hypothetical protein